MSTPNYTPDASGPADYSFASTPNNSTDLAMMTRAIRAAGAGTIAWHNVLGQTQTITVAAGETIPIKARRVLVTGTTATGLEGLA